MVKDLDASDANLTPFERRGGKLLQYHGWSDPQIPAMHSVNYYNSVVEKMGAVPAGFRRVTKADAYRPEVLEPFVRYHSVAGATGW